MPHFYIYDASAGSGKTYTITKEYLSILLQQDKVFAFQNILAITFTNKAAAEMKQRIIDALIFFSGLGVDNSGEGLLQDVIQRTGLSQKEVKTKSFQILRYLIPHYAGFEVTTIDSFNLRIIKTFAKDLNISQGFEVDLDHSFYIKKAVEDLIDDVGIDQSLTTWLIEYLQYKIDNNKSGDITLDLEKYSQLIFSENNYRPLQAIQDFSLNDLSRIKREITEKKKQLEKELKYTANSFFDLIDDESIAENSFIRSSIPKYFRDIKDGKYLAQFSYKWHDIENTTFYNTKLDEFEKTKIDNIRQDIEILFLSSKAKSLRFYLYETILKSFTPLAMLSEIQKRIKKIKEEEGILFINDFNQLISTHIKQQPAPFIYERLGEKFRHYFIDEFQDTSRLQWQNLKPLVENAISTQHDDGISGHLYLVGDVKQSIYQWRGGDAQQFLNLSLGNDEPFPIKAQKIVLENNWRSSRQVVEFNNAFFEFASKYLTDYNHQLLYEEASQHQKKDLQGYVEINFLPAQDNKQDKLELRIRKLEEVVNTSLAHGYQYRDICILVRSNSTGTQIAEAFNTLEKPIPVVSQESLLISSDVNVRMVCRFLQVIEDYHQEHIVEFLLDWLTFLAYPKQDLHAILEEVKDLDYEEFLSYASHINIKIDIDFYKILSLYNRVEYVIRILDIKSSANAYIQFFLDEVYEYGLSKSINMNDFLSHWHDVSHKKSIATNDDTNAVKLMTIHKSKGLEFPIIIYADANFQLADISRGEYWVELDEDQIDIPFTYSSLSQKSQHFSPAFKESYLNNQIEQELANINIAYVSMTRAVEQLYIMIEPIKKNALKFDDLLKEFLKSQDKFEEGKEKYKFGTLIHKLNKSQSVCKLDNSSKAFSSYPIQKYLATLTADTAESKPAEYGKHVHELMQNIKYKNEIDSKQHSKEIVEQMRSIVEHPEIDIYFQKKWKVFNEIDLVHDGVILRPDRVCIEKNRAVILDYKTGVEKPEHLSQLSNYKKALEAMNFSVESAILVYIRKNILLKHL